MIDRANRLTYKMMFYWLNLGEYSLSIPFYVFKMLFLLIFILLIDFLILHRQNKFTSLQNDQDSNCDGDIWCIFVITEVFLFSVTNCMI